MLPNHSLSELGMLPIMFCREQVTMSIRWQGNEGGKRESYTVLKFWLVNVVNVQQKTTWAAKKKAKQIKNWMKATVPEKFCLSWWPRMNDSGLYGNGQKKWERNTLIQCLSYTQDKLKTKPSALCHITYSWTVVGSLSTKDSMYNLQLTIWAVEKMPSLLDMQTYSVCVGLHVIYVGLQYVTL